MAKFLILGVGFIGPAIAHYFLNDPTCKALHVVDKDSSHIESFRNRFAAKPEFEKVSIHSNLVTDAHILHLVPQVDCIISALPWSATMDFISAIYPSKIPLVAIARPRYEELPLLTSMITDRQAATVVGCGLEPGLTEIFAHHLASIRPTLTNLQIYCGGITTAPTPPFFYKQVFGSEVSLFEKDAFAVQDGQIKTVKKFSDVEHINIDNIGTLEAWHDGMVPWLSHSLNLPFLQNISQKTVRWPGFSKIVHLLQELGFTTKSPLITDSNNITPYDFTQKILREHFSFNPDYDEDQTVLLVKGYTNDSEKIEIFFRDFYDKSNGLTSMARSTGFTAAICAQILSTNNYRGFLRPEQLFTDSNFNTLIQHLTANGMKISSFNQSTRGNCNENYRMSV